MEKVIIHYSEISLKKGNFKYFEKSLARNIKDISEKNNLNLKRISRGEKRIFCEFNSKREKITPVLKYVFGIKYFVFIDEVKKDIDSMNKYVKSILKKENPESIAFKTKRADKSFKLKSLDVNKGFGNIANSLGIKIDLSNPKFIIFSEIVSKSVYFYTSRIEGHGGLTVGTSGRVLCLLSGGIDSVAAAWLMIKRGCRVDFLHFHAFNNNNKLKNSKIVKIVDLLNNYQISSKLYVMPYSTYQLTTSGKFEDKYDVVLFKNYILKVAENFAIKNKYDAIVTGDNLAQVASQTIENLRATSFNISIPLFRPLLTYDKQETIDLLKTIDAFDLSIEKYKDCCSIISKRASTKTKLNYFKKMVEKLDLETLAEKSLEEIRKF
ncbi:tRNA 4-thiouridine(8) synthase ThiI [Candidatus Pacearchaeota archaeon]|nr:tRNA 4-thiouridine(8) synthase ThiI [Candidatus Pacearchaeota archaeon]